MNKELKELTNIGIPVYSPIDIQIQDMTLTCSDNTSNAINIERQIRKEVIDSLAATIILQAYLDRRNNER